MKKKSDISYFIIFGLFVFTIMFLFFTVLNPLEVYDADDWLYIAQLRKPIPMIHVWNPTRVFPETAMPAVSYFGALVINPIINNYCRSLTLAHGLFASMVFTIYFVQFAVLFYKRKFATAKTSIAYGCLFILLHFISHIYKGSDNYFMIGAINLTCFYYYVLSMIINAILVMHFMSYGGIKKWFNESNLPHKLIVAFWTYFCINSNLFSSVVLATYVGVELLLNLINDIKAKEFDLKKYCTANWLNLIIIICWFGANILETTGGRADNIHKNFILNIPIVTAYAVASIVAKNVFVTILDLVVFISWFKLHGKKLNDTALKFAVIIGFGILYLIMLSASSEPSYMLRTEVSICSLFYLFMGMIACLNELIKTNSKYKRAPLILLGTLVLFFIFPGRILNSYNYSNITYDKSEALMNDVIDQFKEAEEKGETELVLEIPKFNEGGNWPVSVETIGDRYSSALYRHKIIKPEIKVKDIIVTEEKNEKYGIPEERSTGSF
ncbi:hypothetical protein SAMN05421493_12142 [Pseudobutyrivibrio sp. 49]|uniref:hypothetical protein n=1 Tax=unclassified Pseudobutyrivibrio TaxID=2638619 RepID=UPI000889DEF2|nr:MULTISPECIES: hypothetical protein [unclassified Pseudobutyrivibrio]SDI65221.1 hypothetical protein SAMN05421493_12142 [Pseudobutyrivibrio sp. 49]SFN96477.1 hypothetical protein SAMN04487831_105174 [Pseudobutyrivibrio sp. UC1225]